MSPVSSWDQQKLNISNFMTAGPLLLLSQEVIFSKSGLGLSDWDSFQVPLFMTKTGQGEADWAWSQSFYVNGLTQFVQHRPSTWFIYQFYRQII